MIVALALVMSAMASPQKEMAKYYSITDVATPEGLDPQVGGMAFLADGRLALCFHRGEVYCYDPRDESWRLFADGLHEPLGIVADPDGALVVMQRPELTRLRDNDGDGVADVYETVNDAFGMSGNYHEFAFGPAVDADGDYWVALNTASNGAGIRSEVRGEYRAIGRPGRMYSCVPYRGWVVEIDRETGVMRPFACGFRSPDGIGFDADGRLLVSDNQGDWLGTSKLFAVSEGGFHGHVSSLIWRDDWDRGDPLKLKVPELDAQRTRAAVLFPHGAVANSPTQPVPDRTGGRFGPFAGQTLIGEMNTGRILRLMLEEVSGVVQGAAVTFYEKSGLIGGVHRMAFDAAGRLWVGHTALSLAGGKGLQYLTWTGTVPMEVLTMRATRSGFALTFTRPVDRTTVDAAAFGFRRYRYAYHRRYGSKKFDTAKVKVTGVSVSPDRRTVELRLAKMQEGFVHELQIGGVRSADGTALLHRLLCYTLTRRPPAGR